MPLSSTTGLPISCVKALTSLIFDIEKLITCQPSLLKFHNHSIVLIYSTPFYHVNKIEKLHHTHVIIDTTIENSHRNWKFIKTSGGKLLHAIDVFQPTVLRLSERSK